MPNTGFVKYSILKQVYVHDGSPTGNTKPNVPSDPDYVPPVFNPNQCPVHITTTQPVNSAVKVRFENNSGLFLNFGTIEIKAQTMSDVYFNGTYQRGPGQVLETNTWMPQADDLGRIIFSTNGALGTDILQMEVFWTNASGTTSVRTKTFGANTLVSEQLITIPRVSWGSFNVIKIVFTRIQTTTTIASSTSTTTGTSTPIFRSATLNPNALVGMFVAPNCATGTEMIQVRLRSVSDPSFYFDLLSTPLNPTSGGTIQSVPIGQYIVEVQLAGQGGQTIEINDFNEVIAQSYVGSGIYGFNIINITALGITVNFHNALTPSNPTIYVKLEEANSQVLYQVTLPWGQTEREMKDIKIKFYSDAAGTVSVTSSLNVNFNIYAQDNINSVSADNYDTISNPGCVSELLIGGDGYYKEWDYTLNDPSAQEVNDLVVDETYTYTLQPGFGYLII